MYFKQTVVLFRNVSVVRKVHDSPQLSYSLLNDSQKLN